jgi:hypothetical protein
MRKLLFVFAVILMSGCGNKVQKAENDSDSTVVEQDSLVAADDIEVAPDDMFSEEYLYGWLVRVYDKVNEVWARQEVHQEELDTAFFAKSYLDLKAKVLKAQEGKRYDDIFFIEYMPFSQGLRVPIRLNTVKASLLTGNIAEINFDMSDPDGNEVRMWWHLDFENGQWRIDDYKNDPEDQKTYVELMEEYLSRNGSSDDLSQYAE